MYYRKTDKKSTRKVFETDFFTHYSQLIRYIITYKICHNGADKSEYGVLMYLNECFFKLLTHEGMYVILGVTFWTGMKWAKVSKLLR